MKKTQQYITTNVSKKICVLMYPDFACHGITLLMYLLNQTKKCELFYAGITNEAIVSKEGMTFLPDLLWSNIIADNYDALIIPGGTPETLERCEDLRRILCEFNEQNKLIAAICAAGIQLAKNGLLNNVRYTNSTCFDDYIPHENNFPVKKLVVRDKNIITARGKGFVDFTMEVIKSLNVESEERIKYLLNRYKPTSIDLSY